MEENDDGVWRLTPSAIMNLTLQDFGINTSLPMSKAICDRFMELMVKNGNMEWSEDDERS